VLAPTPRVEEEPIATIVSGCPERIRDKERSSTASIAESAVGAAQFGGSGVAVSSAKTGLPEAKAMASAAAGSPMERIAVIAGPVE
jgi:hypothetical protein